LEKAPRFSFGFSGAEIPLYRAAVSRGGSVIKERKKRVIHRGTIVLAAIVLLLFAGECLALPYRPPAAVSVLSEYSAFKGSARPHTQVWKVVPETSPDGATVLRFFLEASAEAVAIGELRLPAPGAAGEIQWTGVGKTDQKKSGKDMLLVPSFPAPCDVLPVGEQDSGKIYEERIEAGGRVFSKRYRVSFAAFTIGEAKTMGWIKVGDPGNTGLIMVAVTDEQGRPVVKQLWSANGSWWLYEETPLRRSWLIQ
jgi:hypothetical protein